MSLSKKSNIALLVIGLIVIGGLSAYKYAYKPHKSIEELEVKFSGSSKVFLEKVKTDVTKWQGVVIELTGTITSIDEKGITIDNSIYCQLDTKTAIVSIQEKQTITIKARMIGYDDLLEEIKLDKTIIK
ncbi:hypothetical protein [Winogradskyella sp.]|uniref:hypothetical protein n=1 Tax=Winogradskyella sp. TaxID=1883156 RepID=UPI0025D9D536|nr:hypothetical protein [Winogradskyella sp.]